MERPCARCGKAVAWPPIACPYCRQEQPERPPAPKRKAWPPLAAAVLAGLSAGAAASYWRPPRAWIARSIASVPWHTPEAEKTRARVRGLPEREQLVRPEALAGLAAGNEGRVVSAVGVLCFPDIHADRGTIDLAEKWVSPDRPRVDVAALPVAQRKALLRASFPPHLVLIEGRLAGGRLRAERVDVLGEIGGDELSWFLQ